MLRATKEGGGAASLGPFLQGPLVLALKGYAREPEGYKWERSAGLFSLPLMGIGSPASLCGVDCRKGKGPFPLVVFELDCFRFAFVFQASVDIRHLRSVEYF